MTHEAAAAIIMQGGAVHFDPDMCDAFALVAPVFREMAARYADH